MPSFCEYRNCHNLGSRTYLGYCNEDHLKRSMEDEKLFKVLKENPQLSTLKDARQYVSSQAVKKEVTLANRSAE
jgi:hypothetical protein